MTTSWRTIKRCDFVCSRKNEKKSLIKSLHYDPTKIYDGAFLRKWLKQFLTIYYIARISL